MNSIPRHKLWDECAQALLHMDFPRFDSAMKQLKSPVTKGSGLGAPTHVPPQWRQVMTKMTQEAVLQIDMSDLAAILTDAFCGRYTPFEGHYVDNVWKEEGDALTFSVSMVPREEEAA